MTTVLRPKSGGGWKVLRENYSPSRITRLRYDDVWLSDEQEKAIRADFEDCKVESTSQHAKTCILFDVDNLKYYGPFTNAGKASLAMVSGITYKIIPLEKYEIDV